MTKEAEALAAAHAEADHWKRKFEAAERARDAALRKADVDAESFEFWHREAKELTRRAEAAERRFTEVEEELRKLIGFVKYLPVSEGYCMCGSPMDAHDIGSGHAPVDMGEYHAAKAIEAAEAALAPKPKVKERV